MKPEGREVLKLFETNEGILDFLKREHAKKLWMWSDAYIHMFNFLLYSICMSRTLDSGDVFCNEFPIPPSGKYYLVDFGYPNQTGYLAPFKGSIYHILEFHLRRHRPPQVKYEKFNYLHSSLRNVIERSFGVLKQKWRILKSMPSFSHRRQKHIIIACMALHNFIRDIPLRNEDFDKCDEDVDYMPWDEDGNKVQEVAQPTKYDILDEENEVSMNIIRDNIANALFNRE
jgi:hypothetical protein